MKLAPASGIGRIDMAEDRLPASPLKLDASSLSHCACRGSPGLEAVTPSVRSTAKRQLEQTWRAGV